MWLKRAHKSYPQCASRKRPGGIFVTELWRSCDPNSVYYAPDARHPAYRLFDLAALLRSLDAAVQGDDELAGANVWPETARFCGSAQGASHELDEEGVVGNRPTAGSGGHANFWGSRRFVRGAAWEGG